MTKIKADLHMHPYFYNPRDSKRAPDLLQIVNRLFEKNLTITSISACHPKPGDIDYRFFDYMNQRYLLDNDFETDYNDGKYLYIERKKPASRQPNSIFILNSQEVRTQYKGLPADINIIGVKKIINPGQDIDETARIAREEGGIITICHANDSCGAGIEKAIQLYHDKKADAIEINAASSEKFIKQLIRILKINKIKGLPVSDSHYISQAGTSYALFDSGVIEGFSLDLSDLGECMRTGNFSRHIGQINKFSKFIYHTLPVLFSIPGHLIKNHSYIIKTLSKRKL